MKRSTFTLLSVLAIFLMAIASWAGECNPHTLFSQTFTDWYEGLGLSVNNGFYYEMGNPFTNYNGCDSAINWTFAWEDGLYVFGNWGGGSGPACIRQCPTPWLDDSSRMVIIMVKNQSGGTGFLVDSVLYSDFYGRYELDASEGVIHAAGRLDAPRVTRIPTFTPNLHKAQIEIPVPRSGFYSDAGIDPATLIAGVAVLGTISETRPSNPTVDQCQLLDTIPLNIRQFDGIVNPHLTTNVQVLTSAAGDPWFTYTLILNDGTDTPLSRKPLLPVCAPAIKAAADGGVMKTFRAVSASGDSVISRVERGVAWVTAYDLGGEVELEWRTGLDPETVACSIERSTDLYNWEPVQQVDYPVSIEDGVKIFRLYDDTSSLRSDSPLGVVYQISIMDKVTNEVLDTVRTRARTIQ